MTRTSSDINESVQIAHLTMLQTVISRMGANSFTLKALSATFGSAAIAVMASVQKPSIYYAVSAVIPIAIFWLMDAQYLRYEHGYRRLFDHVRKGEEVEAYDLNAEPFMSDLQPILRLAVSWSVGPFYLAILVGLATVAMLIHGGAK